MPVTQITLLKGYEPEVQARLIGRVSNAVRSVIPAQEAGTTTFIQEVSAYRRDARVMLPGDGNTALTDAETLVRGFLQAMQSRDLDAAAGYLASDFEMTFPGGQRMTRLQELVDWARNRYTRIEKTYEGFDQCWLGDTTVVYCFGTLSGQWTDGSEFAGIRFIDRFEVRAQRIQRQDVWNDLAESRARSFTPASAQAQPGGAQTA